MIKPTNFDEALQCFEAMEQRLDLPNWTIRGVYVWKLLRAPMFAEYRCKIGLIEESNIRVGYTNEKVRFQKARTIWEFVADNPFFRSRNNIRRIVILHKRKYMFQGELIEPLTFSVWNAEYRDTSFLIDRRTPLHPRGLDGIPPLSAFAVPSSLLRRLVSVSLTRSDIEIINEIGNTIGFSASVLETHIVRRVKSFLGKSAVYSFFLRKRRPEYLYTVASLHEWVFAARKLSIPVIEFQHGMLGRGHPDYDFRGWQNVPYFPDHLMAFGEDWFDDVSFPDRCQIHPIGSPYIESKVEAATRSVARDKRQLLIVTQDTFTERLLSELTPFFRSRPEWNVVIRPHPNEDVEHVRSIVADNMGSQPDHVRVDKSTPLIDQAAQSWVVLGVNSTAVVESLLAGCRVAIFDMDGGAQFYRKLLAEGNAISVRSAQELADRINDLPLGSARGYYAKPPRDIVAVVEGGNVSAV